MSRLTEEVRLTFIEHEMRARRFLLLPSIAVWEEDRHACRAMGHDDQLCADPFGFPPNRPSYMPSTDEVLNMWTRAFYHPKHKGWKHIAPDGPGGPSKKAARRRSSLLEAKVIREDESD